MVTMGAFSVSTSRPTWVNEGGCNGVSSLLSEVAQPPGMSVHVHHHYQKKKKEDPLACACTRIVDPKNIMLQGTVSEFCTIGSDGERGKT